MLETIILTLVVQFLYVECLIPPLHVHKLNREQIQRQREDTIEMCQMFNEAKYKIIENDIKVDLTNNYRRAKREVKDQDRVEDIVDELYQELAEKGETIDYRRRGKSAKRTTKTVNVVQSRRFNFAPASLSYKGPSSDKNRTSGGDGATDRTPDVDNTVPWIKKWELGIVPFFIDPKTYDGHLAETIVKAFDYIEKVSCIRLQRLRERPTDKPSVEKQEWLYITNPMGIRQCVHSNEMKKNIGVQLVVFGYDCMSQGEIIHEIMHVLGFSHEHTRPDRDSHISILWDNVKPGYKKYFEVRPSDRLSSLPYDHASVLHYPQRAFSRNGKPTIVASGGTKLGQREGLSELDLQKIDAVYGLECATRNRRYLEATCSKANKQELEMNNKLTQDEINSYFGERIWPYGIVNYRIRDQVEFTAEEKENIEAVMKHIEHETCIEFRQVVQPSPEESESDEKPNNNGINNDDDNVHNDDNDNDAIHEIDNNAIASTDIEENTILPDPMSGDPSENNDGITEIPPLTGQVEALSSDDDDEDIGGTEKGPTNVDYAGGGDKPGVTDAVIEDLPDADVLENTSLTGDDADVPSDTDPGAKRVRRSAQQPPSGRRHASNILTLVRSSTAGCKCPDPGKPLTDQILEIQNDCFNSVNDLLHVFVHVLGLDHQHNAHDRDSYLSINWDKMHKGLSAELQRKLPPVASLGFSYDYQSVMHYPWLQIKDGAKNIIYPIWNDGWSMGHWQGLSSIDVQKINTLYSQQCGNRKRMVAGGEPSTTEAIERLTLLHVTT